MTAAAESTVTIDGRFARELPELAVPWQAEEAPGPELLVLNEALAKDLDLDPEYLRNLEGVRLLVGNHVPDGATPVAQAYAGHQFGGYSPLLGDGRALLMGEVTDRAGRVVDIHLKGSGRTPFARAGDGRAVLGPMLREYLISESMHALRIPTTRSLAVVATGRQVRRSTMLPGAVLARVAGSHLRVGSFQYARATENMDLLKRLADHAISRHYPQDAEAENPYLALLSSVGAAQAALVARWMLVGFVHGVMNTDNMTISGEPSTTARVRSWTRSILPPSTVPSTSADAMPTPISLCWPNGTLPALPRPYCRSSTRTRRRPWLWQWRRSAGSAKTIAKPGPKV